MCILSCVCTTASVVCCACKSYVVFALLPAQCAVCVSAVLCLLNVLPVQFAMRGYNKSSYYYFILLFLLFYYFVFALLPVQCAVCVSPVLCLHYCQRRVLCLYNLCCVCTTTSAVCCLCKSCVVFALLPVQCAVCISPVLCLLNVLPVQFALRGLR